MYRACIQQNENEGRQNAGEISGAHQTTENVVALEGDSDTDLCWGSWIGPRGFRKETGLTGN